MTREECELSIVYLEGIKDNYIEGNGYERHPLPEYYAIETAIKALEQEPCEDVISKKDTIEWLKKVTVTDGITFKTGFKQILHDIEQMPPVTPRPKMGYWKVVSDGYVGNAYICECSECKDTVWVYKDADRKWNYCPNCGRRMEE